MVYSPSQCGFTGTNIRCIAVILEELQPLNNAIVSKHAFLKKCVRFLLCDAYLHMPLTIFVLYSTYVCILGSKASEYWDQFRQIRVIFGEIDPTKRAIIVRINGDILRADFFQSGFTVGTVCTKF